MRKLAIYIVFTLFSVALYAQDSVDSLKTSDKTLDLLWSGANTAYINGDYHQAIDIYNKIIDTGLSSMKLYYNIGNAYFKDNQLAQAILFYNRALQINPGNSDIRYNLEIAEAATKDNIKSIPEFFIVKWVLALQHTMGCTTWSVISLISLALMLSLLMLYLLAQRLTLRKGGFYGSMLMLVVFIGSTIFATNEGNETLNSRYAIVMNTSISAKSSPDKSTTDLFIIHEGTKVEIATSLDRWCEIVIADGRKGWVECSNIEII